MEVPCKQLAIVRLNKQRAKLFLFLFLTQLCCEKSLMSRRSGRGRSPSRSFGRRSRSRGRSPSRRHSPPRQPRHNITRRFARHHYQPRYHYHGHRRRYYVSPVVNYYDYGYPSRQFYDFLLAEQPEHANQVEVVQPEFPREFLQQPGSGIHWPSDGNPNPIFLYCQRGQPVVAPCNSGTVWQPVRLIDNTCYQCSQP